MIRKEERLSALAIGALLVLAVIGVWERSSCVADAQETITIKAPAVIELVSGELRIVVPDAPEEGPGFTEFVRAPESKALHVDPVEGVDSAGRGFSEDVPCRTIAFAKSLMVDGDWLLLRRGRVFEEAIGGWRASGISAEYKTVIGAYGPVEDGRPIVRPGSVDGLKATGAADRIAKHVAIVGLKFEAPGDRTLPRGAGITVVGAYVDWHVEDCVVAGFAGGVLFQGMESQRGSNVVIRRNVIVDAFKTSGHVQGVFVAHTDGLVLEGNVFDANGRVDGAVKQNNLSQNVYIQQGCTDATVVGNWSSLAAGTGIQVRCDGEVRENVLALNPSGLLVGTEKDDRSSFAIEADVQDNVVCNAIEIEWGLSLRNLGQSVVAGNVVTSSATGGGFGIMVGGSDVFRAVELRDNVTYGVGVGLQVEGVAFEGVRVTGNEFVESVTYSVQFKGWPFGELGNPPIAWLDNVYSGWAEKYPMFATWTDSETNRLHRWQVDEATWLSEFEPTAGFYTPAYVDEYGRDAQAYARHAGYDDTRGLVQAMRGRRGGEWPKALEPASIGAWIRAGYERAP